MTKGMAELKTNDFASAEEEFRAALKEKPDDYLATLNLGAVLNKKGTKEAASLLKKALLLDPAEPQTSLELGIYYYNKAIYPEAQDYFENTTELAPSSEYSAKAHNYLALIKNAGQKSWRLDVAAGIQYDSNVVVGNDNSALPEGISRKSDWRALLYLKGQYNILTSQNFKAGMSYLLYQSLHAKLSDFNVTQHALGINTAYELPKGITLKAAYSYEYVYVGGDDYNYAHIITPSLTINRGRGFSTVVHYSYSNLGFMDAELFQNNSERTGSNNLVGVTQHFQLCSFVDSSIGYTHDRDSTRKDYWDYKGNKVFLGLIFKLPRGIYVDLYGEYYDKDYDGTSPYSTGARKDDIQTYSLSVTKRLSEKLSISAGQLYIRNKSNVDVFDYERAVSSVYVTARF
jgi:hypothetical protein